MTFVEEIPIGRTAIIKLTLVQSMVFLSIALVYAIIIGDFKAIGIRKENWAISMASGGLLFLAVVPILYLPRRLGITNQLEETIATKLKLRDILSLNFAVSFSEELFFRGFLLKLIGVIPSALVFGAMHYIGYSSFLEVAYSLCVGLLLGYLYKLYLPNILFPITFHFLTNALSLLLTRRSLLGTNGFETSP